MAIISDRVVYLVFHLEVERGDRDLLIQVLQNLFSNAIKYNIADGWIEVSAQQTRSKVQVTITNSSQDILLGDRDHLFERFYRGNPTHKRLRELG